MKYSLYAFTLGVPTVRESCAFLGSFSVFVLFFFSFVVIDAVCFYLRRLPDLYTNQTRLFSLLYKRAKRHTSPLVLATQESFKAYGCDKYSQVILHPRQVFRLKENYDTKISQLR